MCGVQDEPYPQRNKALFTVTLVLLLTISFTPSLAQSQTVVFLNFSHDSSLIHNRIGAFIVQHGYGYDVDYLTAETYTGMLAMRRGDTHVGMEIWIDNLLDVWNEALAAGDIIDLGPNFPNALQGWYVPTYVIEGDPERGIEPLAPDLKSVHDLEKYAHLFTDPEDRRRGRFHNAPTGWEAYAINRAKLASYGLDGAFNAFTPGSATALDVSVAAAYARGLPWVGYHFEPSGIMGMYDMTMLEEPAYTDTCWDTDKACAYPNGVVRVFANKDLPHIAPDVIPFLTNYETTLEQTNALLSYFETEANHNLDDVTHWFFQEYEDVWTDWVSADVAANVRAALP